MKDCFSTIREREVASKQMGRRENKIINIEGRVQFDLLQVIVPICFVVVFLLNPFDELAVRLRKQVMKNL